MGLASASGEAERAYSDARAEVIRRRARNMALVICGIWVPMILYTDPVMFQRPFIGLWLRVPTATALLLMRHWLRRPRSRRAVELVVTLVFCSVFAAFGPVVMYGSSDNNLPNLLSIVIGAMAATAGMALAWAPTAVMCGVANTAMLLGGLARAERPEPLYFWLCALGFVLYPFMIFAAASRDRWLRAEWRAREELRAANERLRHEEHARSQLFINLSHDVRTPLSIVRSEVELLRADGAAQLALDRIEANVSGVVDLLDQLLELARLDAHKAPCAPQRCELVATAHEVADRARPGRADIRIAVRCDAPVRHAHVDPSHLRRILMNLIANALRQLATGGGEIELVIAEAEDGAPTIEVSDDGSGIAPELRSHLFERFAAFPREGSTSSGIGLALARELAQLNGGGLEWVEGCARTTFRLRLAAAAPATTAAASAATAEELPRARASERAVPPLAPAVAAPRSPGPASTSRPTVLLVEDSDDLRDAMCRSLSPCFAIEPAASLTAALASLARRTPAAIVSDIMLPDGDGYELLRTARHGSRFDRIPFLLVSALVEPAERVRGLEAGADDYITKPFSGAELNARITAAIGRAEERATRIEREREDLVMELHDGVCSTLAQTMVILSSRASADQQAERALASVQKVLGEARGLVALLGARPLPWSAVVDSLRWQLAEAAARTDIAFDLTLDSPAAAQLEVAPAVVHALRRIASEALTNSLRHAAATRFDLRLRADEETIYLRAHDDGRVGAGSLVEGRGLSIVRRRAVRCGGRVAVEQGSHGGVVLEAWLPLA